MNATIQTGFGPVNVSQGIDLSTITSEQPWRAWAGDPALLPGDSQLVRQANALCDKYVRATAYVGVATEEYKADTQALRLLHESYLAEVKRAAFKGEDSEVAEGLREKRDAAEARIRTEPYGERTMAAKEGAEQAREAWVSFMSENLVALVSELLAEAEALPEKFAKLRAEYDAKCHPLEVKWHELWEASRKIVGGTPGFSRDDHPEPGDFTSVPLPVAAFNRYTHPAPVEPDPEPEPEPELAVA